MKRILSLLFCAALFAACTKDVDMQQPESLTPEQEAAYAKIAASPAGANPGIVVFEVSSEAADRIEAGATRSGGTRSGIESVDTALDEVGVTSFCRVFPTFPEFEERERAAGLHRWYYMVFDKNADLTAAARRLSMSDAVTYVGFDYPFEHVDGAEETRVIDLAALPVWDAGKTRAGGSALPYDDPHLGEQWHYQNEGSIPGAQPGSDINLFAAWELCTGETDGKGDIIVAVIDEPVQYNHPDLAANMWVNPNASEKGLEHGANFDYTPGAGENDLYGSMARPIDWSYSVGGGSWLDHGTHVAGTIAAVNNNGIGVSGIAGGSSAKGGNVKIMSCQNFGSLKAGEINNGLAAARAFYWATEHGAAIANCSWGSPAGEGESMESVGENMRAVKVAIDYFIAHGGGNSPLKGGLAIFAGGNFDRKHPQQSNTFPAAYGPVIAVASIGNNYQPASYTYFNTWMDIAAPGGGASLAEQYPDNGILSTVLDPATAGQSGNPDITVKGLDSTEKATPGTGKRDGYDYMVGTSMATPHVTGVAALGLAYAAKLGKTFTAEEFKAMLLSSTHSLEPYLQPAYQNKMGVGYIDALLFLSRIGGIPIVTIPTSGKPAAIDFSTVLGGIGAKNCTVEVDDNAKSRLGLTNVANSAPQGQWRLACSKPGSALITVNSTVGGTTTKHKVLLVGKAGAPENGAWL